MLRVLALLVVAGSLSACAGSPVGDALAGPEALAQRDDTYCKSIGVMFGTPEYANCRMFAADQRRQGHAARFRAAAAGAMISQASQPRAVTCNSTTTGVFTNTRCY